MWVSILLAKHEEHRRAVGDLPPGALLVTVDALEGTNEGGKTRWVARDGQSLGDRVLFLGSPASFTVDAAQLGVAGGCAYFVYMSDVVRYNLVNGEAKLVERLRPGWDDNWSFTWLRPQPTIAPSTFQKIEE
jgi:hypothetical protein